MFACDFTKLNRELRQSEYEEATALYGQLIAAGYSETKAIAMVYRAGGLTAYAEAKRWRTEYHRLKHSEQNSPPEAIEKGDAVNE